MGGYSGRGWGVITGCVFLFPGNGPMLYACVFKSFVGPAKLLLTFFFFFWGGGGGWGWRSGESASLRPGSIPGPRIICGLNLLLVLVLAPRVFLLSTKTNTSKSQFDRESEGHRFVSRKTDLCARPLLLLINC